MFGNDREIILYGLASTPSSITRTRSYDIMIGG